MTCKSKIDVGFSAPKKERGKWNQSRVFVANKNRISNFCAQGCISFPQKKRNEGSNFSRESAAKKKWVMMIGQHFSRGGGRRETPKNQIHGGEKRSRSWNDNRCFCCFSHFMKRELSKLSTLPFAPFSILYFIF